MLKDIVNYIRNPVGRTVEDNGSVCYGYQLMDLVVLHTGLFDFFVLRRGIYSLLLYVLLFLLNCFVLFSN